MALVLYPYFLLRFWYKDGFLSTLKLYKSLNIYFVNLLSLPAMIKTFFKPLKNEYRQGLVGFSIGMGIATKSFLIFLDFFVLLFLLLFELLFLVSFLVFPFFVILIFFI